MSAKHFDGVILGAGIMGLFTARELARNGRKVCILEKLWIGNPRASSTGLTRSFRVDHLEPRMAKWASATLGLWKDFERDVRTKILEPCGCLNLVSRLVNRNLEGSYVISCLKTLKTLNLPYTDLDRATLREGDSAHNSAKVLGIFHTKTSLCWLKK